MRVSLARRRQSDCGPSLWSLRPSKRHGAPAIGCGLVSRAHALQRWSRRRSCLRSSFARDPPKHSNQPSRSCGTAAASSCQARPEHWLQRAWIALAQWKRTARTGCSHPEQRQRGADWPKRQRQQTTPGRSAAVAFSARSLSISVSVASMEERKKRRQRARTEQRPNEQLAGCWIAVSEALLAPVLRV